MATYLRVHQDRGRQVQDPEAEERDRSGNLSPVTASSRVRISSPRGLGGPGDGLGHPLSPVRPFSHLSSRLASNALTMIDHPPVISACETAPSAVPPPRVA
jgi:hypothetical protein